MRRGYYAYWQDEDVLPINETQRAEIAKLKAEFVRRFEEISFKKGERITLDPYFRHLKLGAGDDPCKTLELFKWGPWEFAHLRKWVVGYLNLKGFEEIYHYRLRSPVGAIEFYKN